MITLSKRLQIEREANMEELTKLLDDFKSILFVLLPALVAIFYEVRDRIKKEKGIRITKNREKALEIYDKWEHEESKRVISDIKNFCNHYKDRGHADLVQYLQLENGTMATSKIQNMFMTCLAEDDRYGAIPKMIKILQRMPYSETTCWLNKLEEVTSDNRCILQTPDISKADYNRTRIEGIKGIGSVMIAPVFDPGNILLGICVFYYHQTNYNNQEKVEVKYIQDFRNAVESVIVMYHTARADKKNELGLEEE